MSSILPDKVLIIFLNNPTYEQYRFRMCVRILEKYNPRGKDALFESVSALYTLDQSHDDLISTYMS